MKKISAILHLCLLSILTVSCASTPTIKFEQNSDNSSPTTVKTEEVTKTAEPIKTVNLETGKDKKNEQPVPISYPSPSVSPVSTSSTSSNNSGSSSSGNTTAPSVTPTPTPLPTQIVVSPNPVVTPTPTPTAIIENTSAGIPSLGINASLNGKITFPTDNSWNQKIDSEPVEPNSAALISSIGINTGLHPDFGANWNGGPFGIPYIVISGSTTKVPMQFEYNDESDPGPYPIPVNAPIEGGASSTGDRHVIVIDRDNWKLYETYSTYPNGNGYKAGSGAIFDLNSNSQRPAGWTSADAAGLAIFPGLVRYDEVAEQKAINHAIRFTVSKTRKGYVFPATHFASSNTSSSLPPMGMRVRLKSSFDISTFPPNVQVILKAMKTYGMILADNGSNWYFSGAPDSRWNDDELSTMKRITGSNFEVVKMGTVITN